MFFYLKIFCKDKRILEKFVYFFKKLNFLQVSLKLFPKYKKQKFVTVLSSPHINKTAQEQFEYRFYLKSFLVRAFKPLTFFLLLKKLKNLSFLGIILKTYGLLKKNIICKFILQIIVPDNLYLSKSRLVHRSFKTIFVHLHLDYFFFKKYIQLFDLYGEISLKSFFYF